VSAKFSTDQYADIEKDATGPDPVKAWKTCMGLLTKDPKDPRALLAATFLAPKLSVTPVGYHLGRAMTRLHPEEAMGWINYGEACREMWLVEESEKAYQQGLRVARTKFNTLAALINLACLYVDNGFYAKAELITAEILKIDPENKKGLTNRGFLQLAQRNWDGWVLWHKILGTPERPRTHYKEPPEPEWDGTPGKTVVVYAEQGIGDEISFASMIPDAAAVCKKLIFDCDGRLAGLFRRSFPNVKVYGTRVKDQRWDKEDWDMDASLACGQLGEFFRRSEAAFPGTPYLTACPIRLAQWKETFKGKPTVGIAWTGGAPRTNQRNRQLTLKQLLPVLELPARFVSLQYKDATDEIEAFKAEFPEIDLQEYPWATETFDYDDTAALVVACDYIVCMQTAVAHTAGGLGVPVTVLVPKATSWRYGQEGDTLPWYKSLRIIRQREFDGDWRQEIREAARQLAAHLGSLSPGAGEAARGGQLRSDGRALRTDGGQNHHGNGSLPSP
jgi:tetratricopeptide (TPR) repeat protein